MLSTRSLYNVDLDYFRGSERGLSMAMGQGSSLSEHCSSSHSSRRQSPASELDSKTAVSQRKRVPVACERCRKRKIKCSGDEGGGQGCVNCRNAGWDGCQFLRVQSFNTQVNAAAVVNGRPWQSSSRYHPYSYHGHRSTSQVQTQPNYQSGLPPYSTWTASVDYPVYPISSQSSSWTRPSYTSQYHVPYDNEANDPYSTSAPPSYMLPDPEPAPHLTMGYVNAFNRPQHNAIWLENGHEIPIAQHNQHIANTCPIEVTGGHSTYSAITTGANGMSPSQRLLPLASSAHCLPSVSLLANDSTPLSAASQRSSLGWRADTASNASVTSSHTSYSGRQEQANSLTDSVCTSQDLPYTYGNTARTTQNAATTPVLQDPANEPQLHRPSEETRSPRMTRQRYRSDVHERTRSPCSNTVSYNYGYPAAGLQNRHFTLNTNSRPQVDNSCAWTSSKETTRDSLNEACQQDAVDNQTHVHHSPSVQLSDHHQY